MTDTEVEKLVSALRVLGPAGEITRPSGYPNSLAMCVLDSIWSLAANYDLHVVPVLRRYATARGFDDPQDVRDSPNVLVGFIEAQPGGPRTFADLVGNHQRTSTRNGILKAAAVYEAAKLLNRLRVSETHQLLERASEVEPAWRGLPGQRSSATGWRYLLLLAGASEVKPDRMIVRFVERAVGTARTPDEARELVLEAAGRLSVNPAALDHAIWLHERRSSTSG